MYLFFFASRRRHTRCALVTGVRRVLFRSQGGTMTVEIAGGTFTGGVLELSAAGVGGGGAGSATGTGGTATFTQTGGAVTISDMDIVADGFGGTVQGLAGTGIGGIAAKIGRAHV